MERDEVGERAALLAMQERIARDPFEALGLATPTPESARTAFLRLAKTFHPTRFGRMSPEIQRLANEVFLALRAAHDAIVKARGLRPGQSGAMSAFAGSARGTGALAPASKPLAPTPRPAPSAPPARPSERIPITPSTRAATVPIRRTSELAPLAKPGRTAELPVVGSPADRDIAIALEHLQRGHWDAARAILQTLANQQPPQPRYQALVCYALGRQAQVEGRLNEARIELDRALQIDPTLQLAKTALGELFTRRK